MLHKYTQKLLFAEHRKSEKALPTVDNKTIILAHRHPHISTAVISLHDHFSDIFFSIIHRAISWASQCTEISRRKSSPAAAAPTQSNVKLWAFLSPNKWLVQWARAQRERNFQFSAPTSCFLFLIFSPKPRRRFRHRSNIGRIERSPRARRPAPVWVCRERMRWCALIMDLFRSQFHVT